MFFEEPFETAVEQAGRKGIELKVDLFYTSCRLNSYIDFGELGRQIAA